MGRQHRLSVSVGAAFGLVFVLVNAGALPAPWPVVLRVSGVLAFVAVQLALRSPAGRPAPAGEGGVGFTRGYWVVVAVEVVALVTGPTVLARVFELPEAGVAWVALVVGVHFHALAVVWSTGSVHVLGAALAVCGLVGLALAALGSGAAAVSTVGGVVPGFVLLGGGVWAALEPGRAPQPA